MTRRRTTAGRLARWVSSDDSADPASGSSQAARSVAGSSERDAAQASADGPLSESDLKREVRDGQRSRASIRVYPSLSESIRVYPSLSESIRVYPSLSESIRVYPSLSESIRVYPSLSESIRVYPSLSESVLSGFAGKGEREREREGE